MNFLKSFVECISQYDAVSAVTPAMPPAAIKDPYMNARVPTSSVLSIMALCRDEARTSSGSGGIPCSMSFKFSPLHRACRSTGHPVSAVHSPLNPVPTFRRRGRQQRRHLLSRNSGRGGHPRFLRVNFRQLLGADETSAFALDSRLRFDGTLLDASATVHLELILLLGLEIAPLPRRQETFEHAHRPGAGAVELCRSTDVTRSRMGRADPMGSAREMPPPAPRARPAPLAAARARSCSVAGELNELALRCGAGAAGLSHGSRVRENLGWRRISEPNA